MLWITVVVTVTILFSVLTTLAIDYARSVKRNRQPPTREDRRECARLIRTLVNENYHNLDRDTIMALADAVEVLDEREPDGKSR